MKLLLTAFLCSSASLIRMTSASSGDDCQPAARVTPGWSCNDWDGPGLFGDGSPPESHSECAEAKLVGTQCDTDSNRVHWKCGEEGTQEQSHEYTKGTLEIGFEFEVGDVDVTVGGSVEYEKGSTSTHTFGEGEGCGECVAWYMHGLYCSQVWTYESRDPIFETGPYGHTYISGYECVKKTWTVHCTDKYGPSSHTCDRTNCDGTTSTTLPTSTSPSGSGGGKNGGGEGEPHFSTWSGEKYDFMGQCDLVMLRNVDFMDGLGMHVHIRTKIRNIYSYIEAAAIKIGDDVFEVHGGMFQDHTYFVNGVEKAELPLSFGGHFQITLSNGGRGEKFRDFYTLGVGEDGHDSIIIKVKRMIAVHFEGASWSNFGPSEGLMGNYETGLRLGRNGKEIEDADAFAMAWQVGPDDPVLLSPKKGSIQYPAKCKMPKTTFRRLRFGGISNKQAHSLCAGAEEFDSCVYDVVATNIADIANDYLD